jgi:ribonuclease R
VEPFGLFVQGLAIPAEGLVPLDSLPDDAYRYDKASHTLSGRRPGRSFRLGDRVRVAVARVNLDRRELDFRLVVEGGREQRRAAPPPRRDRGRKKPERRKPARHESRGTKRRRR